MVVTLSCYPAAGRVTAGSTRQWDAAPVAVLNEREQSRLGPRL
jgi:hypothetical protein